MFALVLYDEMMHKALVITFKYLVPDDPQMLYLCCFTHKALICLSALLSAERALQTTHRRVRFTLDGFCRITVSAGERAAPDARGWLSVLLERARPALHHLHILVNAAASLRLQRQIQIINSGGDRLGSQQNFFIPPLVSTETFSYSPRRRVSHNNKGGPVTEKTAPRIGLKI